MSHRYRLSDDIPSEVLAARLDQLSNAVTEGREAVAREFTMRVPAECDRDADLVLAAAAARIRYYASFAPYFSAIVRARTPDEAHDAAVALANAVNADLDACLASAAEQAEGGES